MTRDEVQALLDREFPQLRLEGETYRIEEVGALSARMRLVVDDRHLRPGGTVSGPAMMTLVDLAFYVAVLASVGPVSLAVTTNLGFNFLRKPEPRDLLASCRLLKLGRRLAVGEAAITHPGSEEVLCHATGTYSLPGR